MPARLPFLAQHDFACSFQRTQFTDLGQDLTCFSNLLYDGPLRRVPRANKTFHELDQIEKLRCHDTQENEADKDSLRLKHTLRRSRSSILTQFAKR